MAQKDLVDVVRGLMREVLRARFEGGPYAKLSRAHGYADGYMAALLDAGVVDREALLRVVGEERSREVRAPLTAH